MRNGDSKLFLNKPKLSQMLELRLNGYALTSLAILFNCDRSSIAYQCDKFHARPLDQVVTFERILKQVLPKKEIIRHNVTIW